MQRGRGRLAAAARRFGMQRCCSSIAVLALGLAASGCVGGGSIANLTEAPRATVAFESIDGAPPAVVQKFVKDLKEEAGARQVAVVAPGEADFRLRGYLAAHGEGAATAISWVLDAYDSNQRRAFRLSGEERAAGRAWAAADDALLQRIARSGMQQFAALAAARPGPAAATAAPGPPPQPRGMFGWVDDWAPEASGIFRVFRREPAKPEITADAGPLLAPDQVPLPRGRPAPPDAGAAFAFAADDR
jgi:hypothetical protein